MVRLDGTFLRSKVARRVFFMFVVCALVPITGLAWVSFRSVSRQLDEQTRARLHDENRAIANGVFERLELLEAQLALIAVGAGDPAPGVEGARRVEQRFGGRFRSLIVVGADGRAQPSPDAAGRAQPLLDEAGHAPAWQPNERDHLAAGSTLLALRPRAEGAAKVLLANALPAATGTVVGEVDPLYLWQVREGTLPAGGELCMLGTADEPLFCSAGVATGGAEIGRQVAAARAGIREGRTDSGTIDLVVGGVSYLANFRDVPVGFRFSTPSLTSVVMRRQADTVAPISRFNFLFLSVVLLTLAIALLASSVQIRRSLGPVEELQRGTRRIAERDFDTRVEVSTGDELEQLGRSFNTMAERLGKQFRTLALMTDIDRAVLSVLETEDIVATVRDRLPAVVGSDAVALTLTDRDRGVDTGGTPGSAGALTSGGAGRAWLAAQPRGTLIGPADPAARCLEPIGEESFDWWFVLPIEVDDGEATGLLRFGYRQRPEIDDEVLETMRQMADQIAVALSNARLLEELEALNWGTLMALARAVDAKSSWTAGHSERVTQMALRIGEALHMSKEQLEILHRGGLIHDIGKIGIPATILDKPEALTEDEFALMREHPRKGERILAPIPGYASVIPIVVQHHERFDGSGYPDGLAGEAIDHNARVLAVADVYDALISDRPYRPGLQRGRVLAVIEQGAGSHFDPAIVAAFLEIMAA